MKRPPPRPHPLSRSPLAARANAWLDAAWTRGWLPPPELDPEALWQAAAKPFGVSALDGEIGARRPHDVADFRDRLERLVRAIREEAQLNALGKTMAHGQLVRVIRNRLALGVFWTQRPEILTTSLAPPIIVIGHMRSGTTRIHKLLAADPAHSHTRYCDAFHPVPARPDMRRAKAAAEIAMLDRLNPWLQSIHPVASGAVEEELGWLAGALQSSIYESQWHIPGFTAWSEARDAGAIYREFARILRTDAAHRAIAHKPRILKVPAFSENLPELLEQFPDARLILAERAPADVLRSAVSLVANQMAVQSDRSDVASIEAEWRRKIELREARREAALRGWNGPIARLTFDDMNTDWEQAIAYAYRELDLTLTPEAVHAMRAVMAKSHKGAHRDHSAQLRHFGAA